MNQKNQSIILQELLNNINNKVYDIDSDSSDEENKYLIIKPIKARHKKITSAFKHEVWLQYFPNTITGTCQCCKINSIMCLDFICRRIMNTLVSDNNVLENFKPICRLCNNSIGTKNMNDYMTEYGINK